MKYKGWNIRENIFIISKQIWINTDIFHMKSFLSLPIGNWIVITEQVWEIEIIVYRHSHAYG